MKRLGNLTLLCIFALCLVAPAAVQPRPGEKAMLPATPGPKEESRRLLQKSMQRLGRIQKLIGRQGKLGREARADLSRELKDFALDIKTVQINLRELTTEAGCVELLSSRRAIPGFVVVEAPPEPELPPEPAGPVSMAPARFKALLAETNGQAFSDDKLIVVRSATRDAFYNTAQVKALLNAFVHSSDKLDLLRVVAGRIVDPENTFTIYSSLVHSSDKDEARKILESK